MPVSLGEWRVRIGRFVHSVREYVITERKEKLLMERIRRLKLLQKRLLEKKDKSEDECEPKPNDLSVKVDNAQNESNIIDSDTTNDSHKEDRSRSESTVGDEYTFPSFFTLLLSLFSLLLSLTFFFEFDFSNLLASYKFFLNWIYCRQSSWRSTCLIIIIIVCSSLAYVVLPYVIKYNEDLQDNLMLIRDEKAKAKSTIKDNNTPTESLIKENNTFTESTIKANISPTESNINTDNNARTKSTIEENNSPAEFTIKDNNTQNGSTIKECSTPSTIKDKSSKRKISRRKTAKEKNMAIESQIKENNTTVGSVGSTINKKGTSAIEYNSTSTESAIKKKNTTKSTIKYNNPVTESTLKESSTFSTIKGKLSNRKLSKRKITKYKNTATKSKIKWNTTSRESTLKDNSPTESTIKKKNYTATSANKGGNVTAECIIKTSNTPTQSTIKENSATSESTIKDKNTPTESTIKVHNTTSERTLNCNDTKTESTIKEKNSTTESTITDYNRSSKSTIKDTKTLIEPTIKDYNTRIELSIKDNTSTIQCAIKEKNTSSQSTIKENSTPTESPIKGNNSTSESAFKDSNATNESGIKENNIPSRTPTEENNIQPMKVNIAKAEYTIRSGIQKVLSDGKHHTSSHIPSSLKGTTDDPVMQESTCLPKMILVKAGDVELNPGPFDRSANIQEQELVNLAYDVPSSKYTQLCIALGVSYNQSQTILDKHVLDFTRSLHAVFFEWRDRQRDGTDCRNGIAAALHVVNLDALGDKLSRGGYLSQEAASTD